MATVKKSNKTGSAAARSAQQIRAEAYCARVHAYYVAQQAVELQCRTSAAAMALTSAQLAIDLAHERCQAAHAAIRQKIVMLEQSATQVDVDFKKEHAALVAVRDAAWDVCDAEAAPLKMILEHEYRDIALLSDVQDWIPEASDIRD